MNRDSTKKSLHFVTRRQVMTLMGAAGALSLTSRGAWAATSAKLAWTPGASTPQLALAFQEGLWSKHGLEMESVTFATGREALEALLGGGAEFAAMAELPAVTAALRGQEFSVLASVSIFKGHRAIINAKSGAKTIADLAGKKVGTTLGTNMQFLAETVLADAGIEAAIVNVAPGDIVPALVRQDIDAAFMFDSFYPRAREALGDDYAEVKTPNYEGQFLIGASKSFIEAEPDAIKAFMTGLVEADVLADDMDTAAKAISTSTGGTLTEDAVKSQWANFNYEVSINAELLPLMLAEGKWINKQGLITTPATEDLFRPYIAESYLKAVAPERVAL